MPLLSSPQLSVLNHRGTDRCDSNRLTTILHGQPLRSFFPRLTRFSMSTTRALLPRPACYAPHRVASVVFIVVVAAAAAVKQLLHVIVPVVGDLLSASCRWLDLCSTWSSSRWLALKKTGEHQSLCTVTIRVKRRRHGSVAHANLRWATMAAYTWIISKQPRVSSRTKWYTPILWPARRPKHA